MNIEKMHSGIRISDIIGTQGVTRLYIGYTVAQAKKAFKLEFNHKAVKK